MADPGYVGASTFVPPEPTLDSLRGAVQGCRGCDLYADATQAVLGSGASQPHLVLVGEQPGDVEDQRGEPFVGPAGQLLDRALDAAGIDQDVVYKTNAVKHFRWKTGGGKRRIHVNPSRWQIAACQPWLLTELSVLHPPGVVVLGASAGTTLLGSSFRVGEMRGRLLEAPPDLGCDWIVATAHPSAVLRAPDRGGHTTRLSRTCGLWPIS